MTAERVQVLVVEDEMTISMLVEDMLEELGYEVVGPAATIADAMSALERERPTCAILDVNVGGAPIYPVADVLREQGIPYAFSTGYGATALRPEDAGAPVLQKPFRIGQLASTLDRLTASSS